MEPGTPVRSPQASFYGGPTSPRLHPSSPMYTPGGTLVMGNTTGGLGATGGSTMSGMSGQGTPPSATMSDRYIPNRQSQDADLSHFYLTSKENQSSSPPNAQRRKYLASGGDEPYAAMLTKTLFPEHEDSSVLGLGSPQKRTPPSAQQQQQGTGASGSSTPTSQGASTPQKPTGLSNLSFGSPHGGSGGSPVYAPASPHSPSTANFEDHSGSEMNRFNNSLGVVYHTNRQRNFQSSSFRVIPQTPERILDAPELIDDFYLNLIEWGSQNVLTVALGQTVYLWNAVNGDIHQLMSTPERSNVVTGVCWHGRGETLAIGTNDAQIELWDTKAQKQLRVLEGHTGRVGAMSWNHDLLASGSRDSTIRLHDLRAPNPVSVLNQGHTQEVCGLRWSPNGQHLASGGNDNLLNFWDFRRDSHECHPLYQLRHHTAAVKALAWNPVHHNILVSGGGTADKTIRFWDVNTGECLQSADTKSQVCGALWNHQGTELVTSHGYSDNQLTLWKYPSLKRVADLTGHSSRVLHLSQSPNGEVVVSAAGDETIRFWRCFGSAAGPGRGSRRVPHSGGTNGSAPGHHSGHDPNGSSAGGGVAASGNTTEPMGLTSGGYTESFEASLR